VYYIFSNWTKHAYVGQTKDNKGWEKRIQTEIREAREETRRRMSNRRNRNEKRRKIERVMADNGWYRWLVIPAKELGKNTTLRRREEEMKI
jgi:hypothetical protein